MCFSKLQKAIFNADLGDLNALCFCQLHFQEVYEGGDEKQEIYLLWPNSERVGSLIPASQQG